MGLCLPLSMKITSGPEVFGCVSSFSFIYYSRVAAVIIYQFSVCPLPSCPGSSALCPSAVSGVLRLEKVHASRE